jgi:hypothetical protein
MKDEWTKEEGLDFLKATTTIFTLCSAEEFLKHLQMVVEKSKNSEASPTVEKHSDWSMYFYEDDSYRKTTTAMNIKNCEKVPELIQKDHVAYRLVNFRNNHGIGTAWYVMSRINPGEPYTDWHELTGNPNLETEEPYLTQKTMDSVAFVEFLGQRKASRELINELWEAWQSGADHGRASEF